MTDQTNGYPTPDPVDPGSLKCFQVFVPDSPGHISAFKAQIEMLSYWYTWERDDAHTGKDLAALWYTAWNTISESCGGMIRQKPSDPCIIQQSDDGGATWDDVVDISLCVDQVFPPDTNPAGRPQPGEQPGGGTPEPDQCFTNVYTLDGNKRALLPYPISSGWKIQTIDYNGAWAPDEAIGSNWFCPTGHQFFLGTCLNVTFDADGTFPDPDGFKYELIVLFPDGTGKAIRPGVDVTVPTGMATGNYYLMMNDTDISNNQGSITAKVMVCNSADGFHITSLHGGGPTGFVQYGIPYTFTSSPAFGFQNIEMHFDACVRIELVSNVGYNGGFADTIWAYQRCDTTMHFETGPGSFPDTSTLNLDNRLWGWNSSAFWTLVIIFHPA